MQSLISGNIHKDRDDVIWWLLGELNSNQPTYMQLNPQMTGADYIFDPLGRVLHVGPEMYATLTDESRDDEAELAFGLN